MGKNTYQQIREELSPDLWPYHEKLSYVFSHQPLDLPHQEDSAKIKQADHSPEALLRYLKHRKGSDIWLCGGSDLIAQFLAFAAIDQLRLTVMPTQLGEGLPLFPNPEDYQQFTLSSQVEMGTCTQKIYHKIPEIQPTD